MSNDCAGSVQACATRVTRLESDGVPLPGATNMYVSDALVKATATQVLSSANDFELKSACGNPGLTYRDRDRLKRYDLTVELIIPDPQLSEMLTGGVVLTSGAAVGYGAPKINVDATPFGVSIEFWTKRIINGRQDTVLPWWWWAFPRCYLTPGAKNFENAPMNTLFQGFCEENPGWDDGPLEQWPVASDRCFQYIPTASIPATACGYQNMPAS